jgi:serine/threonine-protein kinase
MHRQSRVDPRVNTVSSISGATTASLPDELVEDSVGRLRIAALTWVTLWTIGLVLNHLVRPLLNLPEGAVLAWPPLADVFAILFIVVSLALYRWAPHGHGQGHKLVNVGLVYEVALAFAVGIVNQWNPAVLGGRISWLCVLILIQPLIVPAPPKKQLIASLLAASMDPVGLLVAHLRGLELPSLTLLFWAYLPNYVCAMLAVLPSKIIMRLGRQVSRAREMGSYRLADRIGEGGMGEVWRAQHRLLARPAAIKLIRPGRDDEDSTTAIARFRREAQAAASLRSPHSIQLYDFGVTRDGRFYIVMELLDGLDLETLVRRFGPQPPARVVHLLTQACASLAEAHASGLVHRDIKPANLHLCRLGLDYDFVKVLDFGLAKRDQRGAAGQTLLTAPQATTGTPAYMPPEMASGEEIDARVDLYSLGCVGYFLLTGKLVFEADNALRMILQHLQSEPVPPSARSGLAIPPALDDLILRCLAKDPARRPASAEELANRLARIDTGDPWTDHQARAWWEKNLAEGKPSPSASEPTITLDVAY